MANIRGIELASEVYDLEDESARATATTASQTATQAGQTATQASQTATQASQTATQASQTATQADEKIGNLTNLETTAKTNLVAAINEVNSRASDAKLITDDDISGVTCSVFATGNTAQVIIKGGTEERIEGDIDFEDILPNYIRPKANMYNILMDAGEARLIGYIRVNTNGDVRLINKDMMAWQPNMYLAGQVTFIF